HHVLEPPVAAQAAAAAARQQARELGRQVDRHGGRDRDVDHVAGVLRLHPHRVDVARARYPLLAQRKAVREVLEVERRGHHHREGRAVVAQLDRGLLDQPVLGLARATALADGHRLAGEPGPGRHRAASSTAAAGTACARCASGTAEARSRTGIDLYPGVPERWSWSSRATSALPSGKYIAAEPRAMSNGTATKPRTIRPVGAPSSRTDSMSMRWPSRSPLSARACGLTTTTSRRPLTPR